MRRSTIARTADGHGAEQLTKRWYRFDRPRMQRNEIMALRDAYAASDVGAEHFQLPPDLRTDTDHLVAFWAGEPVGHLHIKWAGNDGSVIRNRTGGTPELSNIGVWPPHLQSHGIGGTLIATAEAAITSCGHRRVGSGVEVVNNRAHQLYERLGYRDWGHGIYYKHWMESDELGNDLPRREPCHYMLKDLSSLLSTQEPRQ